MIAIQSPEPQRGAELVLIQNGIIEGHYPYLFIILMWFKGCINIYRLILTDTKGYELKISYEEEDLIKILEAYAECSVLDNFFEKRVLQKDAQNTSMGLMRRLSLYFKKTLDDKEAPIDWTINNIRKVVKSADFLTLIGDMQ